MSEKIVSEVSLIKDLAPEHSVTSGSASYENLAAAGFERAMSSETTDQPFSPEPNARTRRFADGLELSRAEMSFRTPGPLCLERDAGWLALAIMPEKQAIIDQDLIDRLNELRQKNVQHGPPGKHRAPDGIQGIRAEFFTILGWLESDTPLGKLLLKVAQSDKFLPSIDKVLSCMRTCYAYTGNQVMDPIYDSPRLPFRREGTVADELEEVAAEGTNPTEALLQRPGFFGRKGDKDIGSFSLTGGASGSWSKRESSRQKKQRSLRQQQHEAHSSPDFTPDPNVTSKRFPDGLELSPAEMSYSIPGPLSLERDAGWLALATVMRDVEIDQDYIDHLNIIRQKSLTLGQGKNAWPEFREALGWSELTRNKQLLFLITVIHNMRLMYSHLGNMVMAPVANNMIKVLERAPANLTQVIDALGEPAVVEDVLVNRANLFSHNILAILQKNGGVPPERSERSERARAGSRGATSLSGANRTSRKGPRRNESKDLSLSAASAINPERNRTFEHIHQTFAAAPAERQHILRAQASLLPGGIDALIETCPELIDCDEEDMQHFLDLAADPDITQAALFRKWKQVFSTLKSQRN